MTEFWQPEASDFTIGHSAQQWHNHKFHGIDVSDKKALRTKIESDIKAFLAKKGRIVVKPAVPEDQVTHVNRMFVHFKRDQTE